jgi:hypothetical protein
LNLEKIAQSIADQLPAGALEGSDNRYHRLGAIAISIFGTIVVSFLIYVFYLILHKMILTEGKVLEGIGLLGVILCILCGLLAVYFFARANEIEAEKKRKVQPPGELEKGATTDKLLPDSNLENVVSVTEQTTELLLIEENDSRR